MNTNIKTTFKLHHRLCSRKLLAFCLLLFVVTMAFSCITPVAFNNSTSPFVAGASNKIVSNELELKTAIDNAVKPIVIALDKDIKLAATLVISASKDITLTSTDGKDFFKLIGVDGDAFSVENNGKLYVDVGNTIVVESGGVLKLDGIIVTHESGQTGRGVKVNGGGTLIMYNGEISGNSANLFLPAVGTYCSTGGGVCNDGVFELHSGKISDNCARDGFGGGVTNYGNFVMSGGEITNNRASLQGGGVHNIGNGNFVMSGGEISNNTVSAAQSSYGGGVFNSGVFTMPGGKISNNKATNGGGVYAVTGNIHADMTCDGLFSMLGGEISENTAEQGGGVQNGGIFSMSGGKISNNKATNGGGVYNWYNGMGYNWPNGNFSLSKNAVISNNKAKVGGGIYNAGTFNKLGGKISGNTADQYNDIYASEDSTTNNDDGTTNNGGNITGYVVPVVSIVIIVGVIAAGLFLCSKKRGNKKQAV